MMYYYGVDKYAVEVKNMFKEMRRKDRELSKEEAYELLNRCEYGVLSTMNPDGYPYGVPLDYVYEDNAIYFHCASEGHKLENIYSNLNVSFCVVNDVQLLPSDFSTKYKSVIVFGKAKEVKEEEKRKGLVLLLEKYSKDYMMEGGKYIQAMWDKTKVIKIDIEHISAKGKK